MTKKRRSLQSILIPTFLQNPASPPQSPHPTTSSRFGSRVRSLSEAARPTRPVVPAYDPHTLPPPPTTSSCDSPPPDFLLDEDPFADLTQSPTLLAPTSPTLSPTLRSRRPSLAQPPTDLPDATPLVRQSRVSPTEISFNNVNHPVTGQYPSSQAPIRRASVAQASFPISPRILRPAHSRPAFSSRPSLPSLDVLARTGIVLKKKPRKGTPGARLPLEPWNMSLPPTPSDGEAFPTMLQTTESVPQQSAAETPHAEAVQPRENAPEQPLAFPVRADGHDGGHDVPSVDFRPVSTFDVDFDHSINFSFPRRRVSSDATLQSDFTLRLGGERPESTLDEMSFVDWDSDEDQDEDEQQTHGWASEPYPPSLSGSMSSLSSASSSQSVEDSTGAQTIDTGVISGYQFSPSFASSSSSSFPSPNAESHIRTPSLESQLSEPQSVTSLSSEGDAEESSSPSSTGEFDLSSASSSSRSRSPSPVYSPTATPFPSVYSPDWPLPLEEEEEMGRPEHHRSYEPGSSASTIRVPANSRTHPRALQNGSRQLADADWQNGDHGHRGFAGLWQYGGGGNGSGGGAGGGGGRDFGSFGGSNGGHNGSGGAGGAGRGGRDDGEDRGRDPSGRSSEETSSESEDDPTDFEDARSHLTKTTTTHSDDDVPLARSIPTALVAQKSIRRKIRDEKHQRRAVKEKTSYDRGFVSPTESRGREPRVSASKVGPPPPYYQEPAPPVITGRARTKTLPGNASSPFAVDDLAKKLLNVQTTGVPPVSTTRASRDVSRPPSRGNPQAAEPSRPLGRTRSVAPEHRTPYNPPSSGGLSSDVERQTSLKHARSFHRSRNGPPELPPVAFNPADFASRNVTKSHRHEDSLLHARQMAEDTRLSVDRERTSNSRRPSTDGPRIAAPTGHHSRRPSDERDHPKSPRPHLPTLASGQVLPSHSVHPSITHNAKVQLVQQRVFVFDMQRFHTVEIVPSTTAGDVLRMVEAQGVLDGWAGSGGWMVFEIAQDFGMERPIRSYELLSDVFSSWNKDKMVNALLIKKTPLQAVLRRSTIPSSSPTHRGYVQWEAKRGKWSKRWLELREHSLWLSKRDTGKDQTFLCSLSNFDAYSITRLHKSPKPFVFAVKSTDNLSFFEDTADYLHVFSCGQKEGEAWIERIMLARSYVLHQERTVLVAKSTPTPAPTSGGTTLLARAGTRKQPQGMLQPPGGPVFEPGSLLAKR
ncbi:hypothetical protein JAAARDRAFT_466334 [Jaapia argillacea MUCL 33604]|uniref:PH domain-containing protein n=1 Tax=Jaapia argillacea MUCL 33604 TaxID=933084 RepID=A0A067Q8V9_9AGAM|nr:hypothetical protein JAAARDRAFT_466334 [Jaapia argillacea MUCL 33604]